MEINNTKLVELIAKMKEEKTVEAQNAVIAEILKSRFLCPVIIDKSLPKNGRVEIKKDTKIQFSIIKTTDEKNYLMAFTSEPEVHKWQKEQTQQSIIYTFEDYAMIVTNNANLEGFVIDPMGANILLNKEMIKQIKSNLTHESTIKKDTKIEIAPFQTYPEGLEAKIKDMCNNLGGINTAYICQMKQDDAVSVLLVIDADGKEKEYFNTLASAIIPFLGEHQLDMVAESSEIGTQVKNHFAPIYVKEGQAFKG